MRLRDTVKGLRAIVTSARTESPRIFINEEIEAVILDAAERLGNADNEIEELTQLVEQKTRRAEALDSGLCEALEHITDDEIGARLFAVLKQGDVEAPTELPADEQEPPTRDPLTGLPFDPETPFDHIGD
jgi:hypothetical protein